MTDRTIIAGFKSDECRRIVRSHAPLALLLLGVQGSISVAVLHGLIAVANAKIFPIMVSALMIGITLGWLAHIYFIYLGSKDSRRASLYIDQGRLIYLSSWLGSWDLSQVTEIRRQVGRFPAIRREVVLDGIDRASFCFDVVDVEFEKLARALCDLIESPGIPKGRGF